MATRAASGVNHASRSSSGTSMKMPECGGHSMLKVLDQAWAVSMSPSTAQACTTLPPRWTTLPSWMLRAMEPTTWPVSSPNSRRATAQSSSPSSASPLGMDQMPSSRCVKKGPPG